MDLLFFANYTILKIQQKIDQIYCDENLIRYCSFDILQLYYINQITFKCKHSLPWLVEI